MNLYRLVDRVYQARRGRNAMPAGRILIEFAPATDFRRGLAIIRDEYGLHWREAHYYSGRRCGSRRTWSIDDLPLGYILKPGMDCSMRGFLTRELGEDGYCHWFADGEPMLTAAQIEALACELELRAGLREAVAA